MMNTNKYYAELLFKIKFRHFKYNLQKFLNKKTILLTPQNNHIITKIDHLVLDYSTN
jgi:hypothetical protein